VFQTGSGTSSNMNINEVIANRAIELLGGDRFRGGEADPSQRSREHGAEHQRHVPDGDPRGRRVEIKNDLLPALQRLPTCWGRRPEWDKIIKIGRTHLMDATPLRWGRRSAAWPGNWNCRSSALSSAIEPFWNCRSAARPSARASTRIPSSESACAAVLAEETGSPFVEAVNHFEANAQRDGLVACHGHLRTIANTLFNVANNIRWLGSGPRCGFFEIILPSRQPGSSIMPGKVNPVMCESMMQVAARVMGNDQTITLSGAAGGQFQLNIMMPVMGHALWRASG
jgi:fumarate hydratase, class II